MILTIASFSASITAFFLSVSASFSITFCLWVEISSLVFSASISS